MLGRARELVLPSVLPPSVLSARLLPLRVLPPRVLLPRAAPSGGIVIDGPMDSSPSTLQLIICGSGAFQARLVASLGYSRLAPFGAS